MKKIIIIVVLIVAGYFGLQAWGSFGLKQAGEDVAKALCASPSALTQARQHLEDNQLVGRQPTRDDATAICGAFFGAVEQAGLEKSRALLTLGPGGAKVWEGTVAPYVVDHCPEVGTAEAVGFLAAILLTCEPLGAAAK